MADMEKLSHPLENPWAVRGQALKYENPWIRVDEFAVTDPSGRPGIYGTVHFKNLAIGILPIDDEGNTYLVGQYRFPLKQYSWEIPEGGGQLTVPPLDGAKRELAEETGLVAATWEKLLEMHLSNSVCDEWGVVYLAKGLRLGTAHPDPDEALVVKKVPFEEAYQRVLSGEITDSLSVAGILRAKILLLERGSL